MRRLTLLLAALLLASPCEAQDFAERWRARVASFRTENAQLDPNRQNVVLLGSSSMEGWKNNRRVSKYLPTVGWRALNRGISGDGIGISQTTGIRNRLGPSALDCRPSHIVLLNGRNSLGYGPARTATTYRTVVEKLRAGAPNAVVVLVTCPPVRGRYAHLKDKIVSLNVEIRKIAADLGCELIDLHPLLVGSDGLVRADLSSDGLHFRDAGYRVLGEAIERIVASGTTASPLPEPEPEGSTAGAVAHAATRVATGHAACDVATVDVATRLNLRAGPGTKHRRISSARNGESFEVLGREGIWVKLRLPDGREAWAHGHYLNVATRQKAGAAGILGR